MSTFIVRIEYGNDYSGTELSPTDVAEAVTDKARRLSHVGGVTVNVQPEPVVKEIPLDFGHISEDQSPDEIAQQVEDEYARHRPERCPHCQKELDPSDGTEDCEHCGKNLWRQPAFACNPHEVLEAELAARSELLACICGDNEIQTIKGVGRVADCPVHGSEVD